MRRAMAQMPMFIPALKLTTMCDAKPICAPSKANGGQHRANNYRTPQPFIFKARCLAKCLSESNLDLAMRAIPCVSSMKQVARRPTLFPLSIAICAMIFKPMPYYISACMAHLNLCRASKLGCLGPAGQSVSSVICPISICMRRTTRQKGRLHAVGQVRH